jgi:hypothetical protein
MARPRSLKYSLSLLLTVPMVRGGARCVKDDLAVLPKALEEPQGSAIAVAVPRCKLQNFGQGSVPVDGAEQPVLERVDSANKISKFVRPVYQHRDAARFFEATLVASSGLWRTRLGAAASLQERRWGANPDVARKPGVAIDHVQITAVVNSRAVHRSAAYAARLTHSGKPLIRAHWNYVKGSLCATLL